MYSSKPQATLHLLSKQKYADAHLTPKGYIDTQLYSTIIIHPPIFNKELMLELQARVNDFLCLLSAYVIDPNMPSQDRSVMQGRRKGASYVHSSKHHNSVTDTCNRKQKIFTSSNWLHFPTRKGKICKNKVSQ